MTSTGPRGSRAAGIVLSFAFAAMPSVGQAVEASLSPCLSPPYLQAETAEAAVLVDIVQRVREDLAGFPSLRAAMDDGGPTICLSEALVTEKAYFDPVQNLVVLAADLEPPFMRAVLVHELRHVEQHARGICPSDTLAMKAYVRSTLALEADASTVTMLVAWDLREAGDDGPWKALASWDMTADVARRFEIAMAETGSISAAAAAAFDQWYESDIRQDRYYVATCSQYLDRQDLSHALPSYRQLASDFLEQVCLLPDGSGYPCADQDGQAR